MLAVVTAALEDCGARRVLDFGCGSGGLVEELVSLGFDAYGCDLGADWTTDDGVWERGLRDSEWGQSERLQAIQPVPYRLPFPDAWFDAVVSTSVLEHVQNKAEAFAEIDRVLRPGGKAIHLFPSRWRLPVEPHIYVPFVSWMWPHVPLWWLRLWALLGIRNPFQGGMSWREVAAVNADFCRSGLNYLSRSEYQKLGPRKLKWASAFYVRHGDGGTAKLARAIHLPPWLATAFREEILFVER